MPSAASQKTLPAPKPPLDGRSPLELDGLSYLPHFITATEAEELTHYFAQLHPLWERRHSNDKHQRIGQERAQNHGRITRPVYWLGAWQFASLGYYSEPHFRKNRCLTGEAFPDIINRILTRLSPALKKHSSEEDSPPILPNTCLINYYGSETGRGPPKDQARLRMHQDGEPGFVIMFCIGQAGLLEFLKPEFKHNPELSLWTRHRSVLIFSGEYFKDKLYHRLTQVRHGNKPIITSTLSNFSLRRVSISFRSVPTELIQDYNAFPLEMRATIKPYITELAQHSSHYAEQLVL